MAETPTPTEPIVRDVVLEGSVILEVEGEAQSVQ